MKFSTLPLLFSTLLFFFSNPTSSYTIKRQAPNTAYPNNVNQMTASYNVTFFLLPIPKTTALGLLPKDLFGNPLYDLVAPTGLPNGFIDPATQHLLYVNFGYQYEIKQGIIQVNELTVTNVYVPFVDVLGTGKPFLYNTISFVDFIVASLVGTLTTLTNTQIGLFDPAHAAYKSVGSSDLSFTLSQGITIGGIGLVQTVFQTLFHRITPPYISANTFKDIAAQPYLKTFGSVASGCAFTTFLYNETFANPFFTSGTASVYSPILPSTTTYSTAYGYSVGTEWISPPGTGVACSSL